MMKVTRMKYIKQAEILKKLRRDSKFSLIDVDTLTKINATRLHRLESGKVRLTVYECKKLSDFYKFNIYDFVVS